MAGNLSVETCGNVFASSSRQASSTYGVGGSGRVGQYVDEAYRPWTSANYYNDRRAVTIEVANDEIGGNWQDRYNRLTSASYNAQLVQAEVNRKLGY